MMIGKPMKKYMKERSNNMPNNEMKKHEYTLMIIAMIIAELERCANASVTTIKILEKVGKYTHEQANEIIHLIEALCHLQDDKIFAITDRENELAKQERSGDENAL